MIEYISPQAASRQMDHIMKRATDEECQFVIYQHPDGPAVMMMSLVDYVKVCGPLPASAHAAMLQHIRAMHDEEQGRETPSN